MPASSFKRRSIQQVVEGGHFFKLNTKPKAHVTGEQSSRDESQHPPDDACVDFFFFVLAEMKSQNICFLFGHF